MAANNPKVGVALALVCLVILGVMPVITDSRPAAFGALSFAFFLSIWQLVFALPLFIGEQALARRKHATEPAPGTTRRRVGITVIATSIMFSLSTYFYVLAVEKAGAVSAAIAIVSYPLFAILWETLFLGRRKNALELVFTAILIVALFFIATGGTWRIGSLSAWFLFALTVPLLWSIAHVIIKEELGRTQVTPAQITFYRVMISVIFLGVALLVTAGPTAMFADLGNWQFQIFALAMGLAYYVELVIWFYAVKSIDVSLASSITLPWPALTMVLAVLFLGDAVTMQQIIAFMVIAASIYGLIWADMAKRRALPAL